MTLVTFTVNDEERTLDVSPEMPLLWVLRDTLGLTGTKYSCGIGLCGSCTVHLDGEAVRACMVPASDVENADIITIEGLSPDSIHPLQQAWIDEKVSQCGYCQPGQIMAAAALLTQTRNPADADIDRAMSGNLCRCGTYQRIRWAIQQAGEGG